MLSLREKFLGGIFEIRKEKESCGLALPNALHAFWAGGWLRHYEAACIIIMRPDNDLRRYGASCGHWRPACVLAVLLPPTDHYDVACSIILVLPALS